MNSWMRHTLNGLGLFRTRYCYSTHHGGNILSRVWKGIFKKRCHVKTQEEQASIEQRQGHISAPNSADMPSTTADVTAAAATNDLIPPIIATDLIPLATGAAATDNFIPPIIATNLIPPAATAAATADLTTRARIPILRPRQRARGRA